MSEQNVIRKRWKILLLATIAVCISIVMLIGFYHLSYIQTQSDALELLDSLEGRYDRTKVVLERTSHGEAKEIAEQLGAELRITEDGRFAALSLPEGTSIRDVYEDDRNRKYLSGMSPDYYTYISDVIDGTGEEPEPHLTSLQTYPVTDSGFGQQSYINYLNMGNAWYHTRGSGITVAVIDTGIDTDHAEFSGRISELSYNASEDKIVKDYTVEGGDYDWSLIEDEQGHGTKVTGVIAAAMNGNGTVGIAPDVNIIVIKCECNPDGQFCNTSDLVFGLYYAIERDVAVVNMSFGSPVNVFAEPLRLAVDSDIICIASAGNDATSAPSYPAADINAIGVGALESNGWELADYSNFGENVNVVAPGTAFTTNNDGSYGMASGTSISAPVVTGAVSLFLSQHQYSTFDDVTERLYASSYDLGNLGCDWLYGFGALDVNAFICEETGTVSFNMLTDELDNTEQLFIRNHTLQQLPEPERNYAVFDGWYYDIDCTEELDWYADEFSTDLTLFAKWVNEDDGVPYTYVILDDGTVEIRSYTGKRRFITVPDEIDGRTVSSIGDFAFQGQNRLRIVNLPTGLTHIGIYAFEYCSNLTSIAIPEGVTEIGESAFHGNIRLNTVEFAENSELKTIGTMAFADCSSLIRFDVPAGVTDLDGSVFCGDTSMRLFTVAQGNTAFRANDGILYDIYKQTIVAYPAGVTGNFTIPSSVKTVGDFAFAYTKAEQVSLSGVEAIGASAFSSSMLTRVEIPDSVTVMGDNAFINSIYLKEAIIGKGITVIQDGTFTNCGLTEILIPKQIEVIKGAFDGCAALTEVTFEEGSCLTEIGNGAFSCSGLQTIAIPDSVVTIGDSAFFYTPISSVTFGSNSKLNSIGKSAFRLTGCLESISLPTHLETIGEMAFFQSALKEITVPAATQEIGEGAFSFCPYLENIFVDDANTVYKDTDGVMYNTDATVIHSYPAGNTRNNYSIVESVVEVFPYAFYGAEKLEYITLPNQLVSIGEYAFSYNTSLRSISIPDSVTLISRFAFAFDKNCTQVYLNNTSELPRIGYAAFAYMGIYDFRIPSGVSTIAQYAFTGCNNLTSLTFASGSEITSISAYMFKGSENLRTITFETGSKLTNIQAHGFEGMKNLTSINFGDAKLTNIDNYAFRYCERLQTLLIPDGVTYIGRFAFYGNKALTELTIPESVEYIGNNAFYFAENLNVYFAADTLPSYLMENWDLGIRGYYVGVTDVNENDTWKYATLIDGTVSLIEYKGNETSLDLTSLDIGTVTQIGGNAFLYSDVEAVTLPSTLTSIQQYAFANSALKSIVIPENVTFIGKYAFYNTDIVSVSFGNAPKVTNIEQFAFAETGELTQIKLPASLTALGRSAFRNSGITTVDLSVYPLFEIPEYAFAGTALTSVTIPDTVTLINHNAFRDCTNLANVTFGEGANLQLMSNVFYNTALSSLNIPANMTYIGEYAFVGLRNLTEFEVDASNPKYTAIDGLLYSKDGRKLIACPAGKAGEITLPQSLEVLGFGAFENSKLSIIRFAADSNILTFGYRCFYNAGLTEIDIPASVVSFDYYAFARCEELTRVTFAEGNKLTGIYEGAFYGCKSLSDIVLPDTVIEISDFAFYSCTSIGQIPINIKAELLGIYDYAFAYCKLTELSLPETLMDIGDYAFLGNRMTTLTVPDANKEELIIGLGAFAECNRLEKITLPFIGASYENADISWIGYIFGAGGYEANNTYIPDKLKTVTILEGITAVYPYSLYGITDFETLNLPHSITGIYNRAFYQSTVTYELTNTISLYFLDRYGKATIQTTIGSDIFSTGISGNLRLAEGLTWIDSFSFSRCSNLTGITLPNGVTSIDMYAFNYCFNLESIEIPNTVISIGERAFANCRSLTSITLPNGVTNIDMYAFEYCSNLAYINIPNTVRSIGEGAFTYCSSLTSITLPDGVTNIDMYAFDCCFNLAYINVPNTVRSIGEGAFRSCYNLNGITIPNGLTSIDKHTFYSCRNITGITIPVSVTSIGESAFGGCSSLTTLSVPKNIESIGEGAFINCDKLYEVINNSKLQLSIGSTENGYLAHYASVVINPDGSKQYLNGKECVFIDTAEGFRFSLVDGKYKLIAYFGKKETVTLPTDINGHSYEIYKMIGVRNIIIPKGITNIGNYAFDSCSSLTSITIPDSVTCIGENAFYYCSSLTSITIPDSVTSIGEGAFYSCSSMTSAIIPDSVTRIEGFAFAYCDLKSITIPASVESLSNYVFAGCRSLTSVVLPENFKSIGYSSFIDCESLTSINFPETMTYIGESAFSGCESLTKIFIPDSVTIIRTNAFAGCNNLTDFDIDSNNANYILKDGVIYNARMNQMWYVLPSVTHITVPASVTIFSFKDIQHLLSVDFEEGTVITSLGSETFSGCTNLTSVTIPDSVTSIGEGAFYSCSNLTSVTIPDSVTSIGRSAFEDCSCLTSIIIPDSVTSIDGYAFAGCNKLTSIIIPDSVRSIGESAFRYCHSLTSAKVPDGVTNIDCGLFMECNNLTSIAIPDGVTSIGASAFYGCALTSVTIPDGVTSIGASAFYGCALTSVTIPDGVTSIGASAFFGCALTSVTIPSSVTSIEDTAFGYCGNLCKVINNSNLKLSIGSKENGEVAYYALVVINKDGNRQYKNIEYNTTWICTADEFLFSMQDDRYYLRAYIGNEDTVTLPQDINGNAYEILSMRGVFNVIIPDGITSIRESAFMGCSSLKSISIPDSVESIGRAAFCFCGSLVSINIPDSVTSIGSDAFFQAAYCENPANWQNGCLYIGNHLIDVDNEASEIVVRKNTVSIVPGAFDSCFNLKTVTIGRAIGGELYGITNIETLILTEDPLEAVFLYFNYDDIPLTLKNIIITEESDIYSPGAISGITGVTVYVEAEKIKTQWDHDYPGWNNGNQVYYGGEWITSEFYDINNLLIREYRSYTQIVRQPYVDDYTENGYMNTFSGWDINSDGKSDFVPASSSDNICAVAVYDRHPLGTRVVVAPTCEKSGVECLICLDCGMVFDQYEIPVVEHDYIASGPVNGVITYTCSYCDDSYTVNAASVKLSNTAFTTAWNLNFTTGITGKQLTGSGGVFTLIYDPQIVTFVSAKASSGVAFTRSDNRITVTVNGRIADNAKLLDITFKTSDELASGDYAFLSVAETNNQSDFSKLTIFKMGDVNLDGNVNSRDATMIKQYSVKMVTLTEVQKVYADAYVDGSVNSRDATIITQYIVKMPVKLGDRVEIMFDGGTVTNTVTRSVHEGKTLTTAPTPPKNYRWSASKSAYQVPVYTAIKANEVFYLIRKETV